MLRARKNTKIYHSEPVTRWLILGSGKLLCLSKPDIYSKLQGSAKTATTNTGRANYFELGSVVTGICCIVALIINNIIQYYVEKSKGDFSEITMIIILFLTFILAFFATCAIKFRQKYNKCLISNNDDKGIEFNSSDFWFSSLLGFINVIVFFIQMSFIQ